MTFVNFLFIRLSDDEIDRALVPTNPQIDDEIQVMESFQVLEGCFYSDSKIS